MGEQVTAEALQQHWVHSHEEDTPTERVYRPASYEFPPARGRTGFDLRPDGQCVLQGIGPTDAPQATNCTWQLEDDGTLALYVPAGGTPQRGAMKVVSVSPDRLVVQK